MELSKRRFGVEIECGYPGGYYTVDRLMADNGIEADVGSDGSGVECRVGPLKGKSGFKTLEKAMRLLKEGGGYVSLADGLHVHFEAKDFIGEKNWDKVVRLADSWSKVNDAIDGLVIPDRRHNGACPKYLNPSKLGWRTDRSNDLLTNIKRGNIVSAGRGDLNLSNILALTKGESNYYTPRPTIEIRIHEGCIEYETAAAWIQFGQRLLDHIASGKRLRTCADPVALMNRIKLPAEPKKVLIAKTSRLTDIESEMASRDPYFGDYREYCSTCDRAYYPDGDCSCAYCERCGEGVETLAPNSEVCEGCLPHQAAEFEASQEYGTAPIMVTREARRRPIYYWQLASVDGCSCYDCRQSVIYRQWVEEARTEEARTNRNIVL